MDIKIKYYFGAYQPIPIMIRNQTARSYFILIVVE